MATWNHTWDERQPTADPQKRDKIAAKTRAHNTRASSSMGMTRILSQPEKSTTPQQQSKASKFIMNSGNVEMQSLKELDRKTKHAIMKTQSNAFA